MLGIQLKRLNNLAATPSRTIATSDSRYEGHVNSLADKIINEGIRVVLLAGPSASGKTTTANLICDAILQRKRNSFVVSLDDFYRSRDDENYPRLEDGSFDYESPESLCLDELRATLADIADGKPFTLPKFDFKIGARSGSADYPPIRDGCVIVEGLHALNPKITQAVYGKSALKVFVSVLTKTVDGEEDVLSGRKTRFVRRVVRDSIFRASSAERTFSLWWPVLDGETQFLYPFQETADVTIDTFHYYELGVMRNRALEILTNSAVKDDEYVQTVIKGLKRIKPIDISLVPDTSLIREFVAGGAYENLY